MAQWTPQQLQQMAALLQGTHNNLAVDAALAGAPTQRWAVDAQGQRIDPYASNPATAAIEEAAPRAPVRLPRPTAAYAPQTVQARQPQVSRVSGRMRFNPLVGTPAGALLSMFGKGRPQQSGGLMGLMGLMDQVQQDGSQRRPVSYALPGMSTAQAYDETNERARTRARLAAMSRSS